MIAREAYDSAIMAPLFIAMSLSFGAAIFILVVVILGKISDLFIEHQLWPKLQKLLAIFIASNLYLTCIQHLTAVYATEHHSFEKFISAYK